MSGRHGSMGCEKTRRANLFGCFLEALTLLNQLSYAFEKHERSVPFVRMKYSGMNSEGSKDADPADTENDLLPDAMLFVAAIEPRGEFTVALRVLFDIRVHQI